MRVVPIFAWYDFWAGIYWDRKKRCLYVLPVPMFGLRIDFAPEQKEKAVIDQLSANWWRER